MKILVTGSNDGLGQEITGALLYNGHDVIEYDINDGLSVEAPNTTVLDGIDELDVLINNAGINELDWLDDLSPGKYQRVMNINAGGIYMMSRAFLPWLIKSKGTIINITSNAAHMPMTCSLAYNASKGAAHIMTLQMARELTKRYGITVFGIAPNRLSNTAMSEYIDEEVIRTRGWTREYAQEYQRNALLTGEETPPYIVAEFIAYLLTSKEHHRFLTGTIIPYGA